LSLAIDNDWMREIVPVPRIAPGPGIAFHDQRARIDPSDPGKRGVASIRVAIGSPGSATG
jgi:hypothetical protein